MADVTISQLPDLTPTTNTQVPVTNGITTGKATVAQINALVSAGSPTGSIIMWPLNTAPTGYLICNGSAISRTTYSALFAILGTSYGSGDGSTTFNIPDYRGQFLRGWSNGSTTDPDRATRTNRGDGTTGDNVGTKQGYEIQSHSHTYYVGLDNPNSGNPRGGDGTNWRGRSTVSAGGSETRPTNVYINYCIKT